MHCTRTSDKRLVSPGSTETKIEDITQKRSLVPAQGKDKKHSILKKKKKIYIKIKNSYSSVISEPKFKDGQNI